MDLKIYIQTFASLLLVISLIFLCALLFKKLGRKYCLYSNLNNKRLEIISSIMLDPTKRLVLIRKDDIEHLLLLGKEHSILIESTKNKDI